MNDDYRRRESSLGSLLTGIVIGAAAALWANDSSRAKIREKFSELTDVGKDKMQQGKRKVAAGLDQARKKLEEEDAGESF